MSSIGCLIGVVFYVEFVYWNIVVVILEMSIGNADEIGISDIFISLVYVRFSFSKLIVLFFMRLLYTKFCSYSFIILFGSQWSNEGSS